MWAAGENGLVLGYGDWAVGVEEFGPGAAGPPRALRLSVRPNPCRGLLAIEAQSAASGDCQLDVHDVAGRCVQQVTLVRGQRLAVADLRQLPGGVYFIRQSGGTIADPDAARFVLLR